MKKLFEKHETLFCILLIAAYIVINSYCIQNFGIEDYRSAIINTVFSVFLIVLMILLSLVAIFIISNAIRMTVFARRRDIGIAKFLGATDWFIRWPFIVEGIIMGVVGSLIALVLVIPAYNYIYSALTTLAGNSLKFYTTGVVIKEISLWFIGIGAMLGAFGSGISLGRYLKV